LGPKTYAQPQGQPPEEPQVTPQAQTAIDVKQADDRKIAEAKVSKYQQSIIDFENRTSKKGFGAEQQARLKMSTGRDIIADKLNGRTYDEVAKVAGVLGGSGKALSASDVTTFLADTNGNTKFTEERLQVSEQMQRGQARATGLLEEIKQDESITTPEAYHARADQLTDGLSGVEKVAVETALENGMPKNLADIEKLNLNADNLQNRVFEKNKPAFIDKMARLHPDVFVGEDVTFATLTPEQKIVYMGGEKDGSFPMGSNGRQNTRARNQGTAGTDGQTQTALTAGGVDAGTSAWRGSVADITRVDQPEGTYIVDPTVATRMTTNTTLYMNENPSATAEDAIRHGILSIDDKDPQAVAIYFNEVADKTDEHFEKQAGVGFAQAEQATSDNLNANLSTGAQVKDATGNGALAQDLVDEGFLGLSQSEKNDVIRHWSLTALADFVDRNKLHAPSAGDAQLFGGRLANTILGDIGSLKVAKAKNTDRLEESERNAKALADKNVADNQGNGISSSIMTGAGSTGLVVNNAPESDLNEIKVQATRFQEMGESDAGSLDRANYDSILEASRRMGEAGLARPVEMKNGVMITNGSDPLGTVAKFMGLQHFRNVNADTVANVNKEDIGSINKLYNTQPIGRHPAKQLDGTTVNVPPAITSVLDGNFSQAIIGFEASVELKKELVTLSQLEVNPLEQDSKKVSSGDVSTAIKGLDSEDIAKELGIDKGSAIAKSLKLYGNNQNVRALLAKDPKKAVFLAVALDIQESKNNQSRNFKTTVRMDDMVEVSKELNGLEGIIFNPNAKSDEINYSIDPDRITSPLQIKKISTLLKQIETFVDAVKLESSEINPALKNYGVNSTDVTEFNAFTKAIHDDILKDSKEIASRNPETLVASANSIIYLLNLEAEQTSPHLGTDTYEWRRISKLRKMALKVKTIEDVREIQFEVKEDEYMEEAADSLVSGFRGSMSKFGLDEADPFLTTKGSQERRVRLVAKNNGVSEADASRAIRERALQLAGEDADSIIQQEINQRGESGIEPTEEPKVDTSDTIKQLLIDAQKRGN
jgi:NACalpha-BTF3-like transcription factor